MSLFDTPVNDPLANGPEGYRFDRIQARKAWDIKHHTNQIVAVIDGGLWYRQANSGGPPGHPDIVGNIFSGVSGLEGTNMVGPPNDPFDDREPNAPGDAAGHGTHVAGIIGARGNNSTGSTGVAWSCQLLPFKIFGADGNPGGDYDADVATSLDRAVVKGARIINMSFGGSGFSQKIADAVKGNDTNANAQAVMVTAAGNGNCSPAPTPPDPHGTPVPVPEPIGTPEEYGGSGNDPAGTKDLDKNPRYPAALPFPNVIAVANSDQTDDLHCTSRYGKFTVDLAAPGTNIVSTLNAQSSAHYGSMTGTSMAAPHVSGTLALVRETFPQSSAFELLDRIRMGVDVLYAPAGQLRDFKMDVSTGGRLNAYRALLPRSKMANVSSRAKVETGDNIVINGFILRSNTRVVVRAIGPSLPVSGPLVDPSLQLFNSAGIMIAENDNWRQTQEAAIQATGLAPSNDLESAIVMDLDAGAYTAIVRGVNDGQGIALNEVFELTPIADPAALPDTVKDMQRTQNLSSRVMVRGGDQIAILGVIVEGRGIGLTPPPARRVLIRALGPSLEAHGVSGFLADPHLRLFDSAGNVIAENDNWRDADTSPTEIYRLKIREAGVEPGFAQEAIIIATLTPGTYTVHCRGADGGQGIALVEMYEY
jgi:subtilisin family serine protease